MRLIRLTAGFLLVACAAAQRRPSAPEAAPAELRPVPGQGGRCAPAEINPEFAARGVRRLVTWDSTGPSGAWRVVALGSDAAGRPRFVIVRAGGAGLAVVQAWLDSAGAIREGKRWGPATSAEGTRAAEQSGPLTPADLLALPALVQSVGRRCPP